MKFANIKQWLVARKEHRSDILGRLARDDSVFDLTLLCSLEPVLDIVDALLVVPRLKLFFAEVVDLPSFTLHDFR